MFKPRTFLQLSARARALCAVGVLSLVAVSTALAGSGSAAPRIPWAVPTIPTGNNPVFEAVNDSTHTLYVMNGNDGTISVVDSSRCNSRNASQCQPIATLKNLGFGLPVVDPATHTLYAGTGQGVAVIDTATCNAENTSGCGQTPPATISVSGAPGPGALDIATHTLYIGDGNEGPVSLIDTASCNATDTSGCSDTPVQTATNGDSITVDDANHSVYVMDYNDQVVRVFDGATCNATDISGCGQTPNSLSLPSQPVQATVDEASGTLYVPIKNYEPNHPGAVALVNTATCNGTVSSGCATTHLAPAGIIGPQNAIVDPVTNTVYVANEGASSVSVLNGATCNAHTPNLCPTHPPALAAGFDPGFITLDSQTETIYESSQAMNDVWLLNAAGCNAIKTSGCTRFAPTTTTDDGPSGVVADPATHTVYANDREANKISVIDTSICNAHNLSGCGTAWPEISVGDAPHASAFNPLTHTLYVNNRNDNTLSVIDTATCNATVTSGCANVPPTTAVGGTPQQEAVDEATDTIYVANGADGTVSVVNGAVCNAGDTSGCGQTWPTVTVGNNPTAIGFNPVTDTIYVANTNDDTVSVIDGSTCNGGDSGGCGQAAATIAVGSDPVSVGVDPNTDTIFVGNSNDGTVSVIDGSACNGKDTSGCRQTPSAVGVGTPNSEVSLARSIAFDPTTQQLFVPVKGDSAVGVIDGNTCRGSKPTACSAKIVPFRMGGFGTFAAVDTSTGTVYVGNNDDGTFSLFPDGRW